MPMPISIRLTAIQASSMNPIGTCASPVSARAKWGTKVHYRVAIAGVSSTFLIDETPHSVCNCLTKYYFHRIKLISLIAGSQVSLNVPREISTLIGAMKGFCPARGYCS
jgi:hypothetical protein